MMMHEVQTACSFATAFPWQDKMVKRDTTYMRLMASSIGCRNSHLLARMIASWCVGDGVIPDNYEVIADTYRRVMEYNFPEITLDTPLLLVPVADEVRLPERDDLLKLLLDERAGNDDNEIFIAEIIAAACMGNDHLWQDLGLWSRTDLSDLLHYNYPTLAARNDRDMKWKKFLYKQLCNKQGIYVCRAPSCSVCSDYEVCFGRED